MQRTAIFTIRVWKTALQRHGRDAYGGRDPGRQTRPVQVGDSRAYVMRESNTPGPQKIIITGSAYWSMWADQREEAENTCFATYSCQPWAPRRLTPEPLAFRFPGDMLLLCSEGFPASWRNERSSARGRVGKGPAAACSPGGEANHRAEKTTSP